MHKKLAIGIIFVLLIINVSGCIETDSDGDGYSDDIDLFPNNANDWIDSDNDGVGDNTDDFPDDSNLYEKTVIDELFKDISKGVKVGDCGGEINWKAPSDAKYVFVYAQIETYIDEIKAYYSIDTTIFLTNPERSYVYTNSFSGIYSNGHRITITTENWGEWRIWFCNNNKEGYELTPDFQIYIYK